MNVTASRINPAFNRKLQSPPRNPNSGSAGPIDSVELSTFSASATPNWAPARTKDNAAKLTGFQTGALILGSVAALAGVLGAAAGGMMSPPSQSEKQIESVKETDQSQNSSSEVDLAAPVEVTQEVEQEQRFEDGRQLLYSRPGLVGARKFQPDPSQAIAQRGTITTFSEEYIDSLVNRNLTEVPEGQPSFTADGVDPGQSSKLYFDAELQPADWGYGAVKTGGFHTRPTRMRQGMGLNDEIIQHQISAVYRLENKVTLDGVTLEPGVYRLITLEASSRVATPQMHRSVAPGHRLVPTGSGFAGDYKPVQTDESGRPLKVNPDDIVQIWTLTPEEAAQYGN